MIYEPGFKTMISQIYARRRAHRFRRSVWRHPRATRRLSATTNLPASWVSRQL